jgi:hypothetical protein
MKTKFALKLVLMFCVIDWLAGTAMPFFDLTQLLGAQTITAVSGTVRDVNGVPYVNCTVLPQFVNVSGGATPTVTANGGPVVPPTSPSTCNSSGVFNVSVIASGSVTPASTHWQFLICSAPGTQYPDPGSLGSQCFTTGQITISGSTQDITGNINAVPPPALIYADLAQSLGSYQGTTSVGITDTAFHALIAAGSDIKLPANLANIATRKIRVHGSGVYTNAAASLLNVRVDLCTVSGCATGTDFAAAGCAVVTTNQANNLSNGQFTIDCTFTTTSTVGSSGTLMAKSTVCANLGAATSAVLSCFPDTATAVSAAVDETVDEFINISFKFSTSNAGNSAILLEADAKVDR